MPIPKPDPDELGPATGTAMAFYAIDELLQDRRMGIDNIAINASTIVRNRVRTDVTSKQLMEEAVEDLNTHVQRLFDTRPTGVSVLVYLTDHYAIGGPEFARPIPPSKNVYIGACSLLRQHLRKHKPDDSPLDVQVFHHVWPPSRLLAKWLKQHKNTQALALVSHAPMDFHVQAGASKLLLVESFTGATKKSDSFADKIFGTFAVPFCPTTHALMGDKVHFKPIIMRKERKELLGIAEQERWRHKSESLIRDRLRSMKLYERIRKHPILKG